jgi:hypothetical protein
VISANIYLQFCGLGFRHCLPAWASLPAENVSLMKNNFAIKVGVQRKVKWDKNCVNRWVLE